MFAHVLMVAGLVQRACRCVTFDKFASMLPLCPSVLVTGEKSTGHLLQHTFLLMLCLFLLHEFICIFHF
jgi:hypothetical protein